MPAGRPLLYTAEYFQKEVDLYFRCLKDNEMPTKAGLLLHLDIGRETWREYKLRNEFVDTIKRAEFKIENAWVQRLPNANATGPIFYLKNAFKEEYKDRQDITSDGKPIEGNTIVIKKYGQSDAGSE